MSYFLLFVVSITSASIFDALPVWKTGKNLLKLQRESLKVLTDSDYSDDQKQKILLSYSGKIFLLTLRLLILFFAASLPLALLIFIGSLISEKHNFSQILLSFNGIFKIFSKHFLSPTIE